MSSTLLIQPIHRLFCYSLSQSLRMLIHWRRSAASTSSARHFLSVPPNFPWAVWKLSFGGILMNPVTFFYRPRASVRVPSIPDLVIIESIKDNLSANVCCLCNTAQPCMLELAPIYWTAPRRLRCQFLQCTANSSELLWARGRCIPSKFGAAALTPVARSNARRWVYSLQLS